MLQFQGNNKKRCFRLSHLNRCNYIKLYIKLYIKYTCIQLVNRTQSCVQVGQYTVQVDILVFEIKKKQPINQLKYKFFFITNDPYYDTFVKHLIE